MYHDFESYTITRRSFLKGAGAVGAASLLAACVTAFAGPISFVGIAVPHLSLIHI